MTYADMVDGESGNAARRLRRFQHHPINERSLELLLLPRRMGYHCSSSGDLCGFERRRETRQGALGQHTGGWIDAVGVDHVTLDMVVAVDSLGVVRVVLLEVTGLTKPESHELAVGSVVL